MAYNVGDSGHESIPVGNNFSLDFYWEIISQNASSNRSTISWKIVFYNNGGRISSRYSGEWYFDIDGESVDYGYKSIEISSGVSEKILGSGTTSIENYVSEDTDFAFEFGWDFGGNTIDGKEYGWVYKEFEIIIANIEKNSLLFVDNGVLGVSQVITLTTRTTGVTHTLSWSCGGMSGDIATMSADKSFNFAPPIELASTSETANQLNMTFTLKTYSRNKQVGSTVTKTIIVDVPSSVLPTCTFVFRDASGNYESIGYYLQGSSYLEISVNASGSYGSTIDRYKVVVDGRTYGTSNVTTDVLRNTGTQEITVTVTDSRGRSAESKASIYVRKYDAPRITHLSSRRCNVDGSDNIYGKYANIIYSYEIFENFTVSPIIRYKKTSDTNYLYVQIPAVPSASMKSVIVSADDGYAYDIELIVSDDFGSASRKTLLSTAYAIIHFPASGKGITFGGVAISDGFNCNMPADFTGGLSYSILGNENANCNLFLKSGTYYIDGANSLNTPGEAASSGFLHVKASPDNEYVYQKFITTDGDIYTRIRASGTFGSWESQALIAYPIGSVYMSFNPTSPKDLFGGEWMQIEDQFLLAAGAKHTAGTTGGAEEVTLTVEQMPSHRHVQRYDDLLWTDETPNDVGTADGNCVEYNGTYNGYIQATEYAGGGQAHNNMPPYLAVYMWKRIA